MLGTDILTSSVTAISKLGFWLLSQDKEYFVPFTDYPAFTKCPIDCIFNVQFLSPTQLYWPEIDVDIEIDALEKPTQFPLVYQ